MLLDLVVLGNLIVDDIVYEDGRTRMAQPGGAVLYMGLAAALWDLRVGLVSIAGTDFPTEALDSLAQRGLVLDGVTRTTQPGLRTWLLYEGNLRRVVHRMEGSTHREASPTVDEIPSSWRPRAIHLAPTPFDLQLDLARSLRSRYGDELLCSLDPYELMSGDQIHRWQELLEPIDLLLVSEDEIDSRSIRKNPEPFLRQLLIGRLSTILFKQGPQGGLAVVADGTSSLRWAGRNDGVTDSTGAGDAFASGVLAGLLRDRPLEQAIQRGVVSASFAIEAQGAEGLLRASPQAAQERLDSWFPS